MSLGLSQLPLLAMMLELAHLHLPCILSGSELPSVAQAAGASSWHGAFLYMLQAMSSSAPAASARK